jgi:hypothetical protein
MTIDNRDNNPSALSSTVSIDARLTVSGETHPPDVRSPHDLVLRDRLAQIGGLGARRDEETAARWITGLDAA